MLGAGGSGDDTDSGARPTTTVPSSSTASTTDRAPRLGAPVGLGDGTLVGVHPSEPIAYVSIVDRETDQVGCEGGDVARLWAQPIDGSAPKRALPDSFL